MHVFDHGLAEADDRTIWLRTADLEAVLVTKDEDFAAISALEPDGPAVTWIRLGNTRRRALLEWFERMLPDLLSALERGDRLVELS